MNTGEGNISIWLVCKSCRRSLDKVADFIEHKKEKHFFEFQQATCFVFEERILSTVKSESENDESWLYLPSVTVIEETPLEPVPDPPKNTLSDNHNNVPNSNSSNSGNTLLSEQGEITLKPNTQHQHSYDYNNAAKISHTNSEFLSYSHAFREVAVADVNNGGINFPSPKSNIINLPPSDFITENISDFQQVNNQPIVIGNNINVENKNIPKNTKVSFKSAVDDESLQQVEAIPSSLRNRIDIICQETQVTPQPEFSVLPNPNANKPFTSLKDLLSKEIKNPNDSLKRLGNYFSESERQPEPETVDLTEGEDCDDSSVSNISMSTNASSTSKENNHHILPIPVANIALSTSTTSSVSTNLDFRCGLCNKQCNSDGELKIHIGICILYHKNRNCFCGSCNTLFFKPDTRRRHILIAHPSEYLAVEQELETVTVVEEVSKTYGHLTCEFCSKKFMYKYELAMHSKSHKGIKKRRKK